MTWTVERSEEGYRLIKTDGSKSRTVYLAMKAGDAADFLAMAEVYELLRAGAPVEAFKPKPGTRRKAVKG